MLSVRHLVFDYPGHRALDDVSFRIEPKSITALVGPNGAGKSTLLRCCAALDRPFAGIVEAGRATTSTTRRAWRTSAWVSCRTSTASMTS